MQLQLQTSQHFSIGEFILNGASQHVEILMYRVRKTVKDLDENDEASAPEREILQHWMGKECGPRKEAFAELYR
jgi:hypothetical protein